MANNQQPLVSIIIPVYNGSNYLRDAIDSALSQTYSNIEILVINDGSTDNTEEIAKSYGSKIRYYKKPNGGVSSALNFGISKMKGEYFSWLSHDDMYLPEKVEEEVKYLSQHNFLHKKAIVYSDYMLIDKRGKYISEVVINHQLIEKKPDYCLLRGLINGNSLLIPIKAFKEYGDFDTHLACTQDYEKWFQMMQTYKFYHVPAILVKSRYHAKQTSNTSNKVDIEGNDFWIKLIKSYNHTARVKLNGSDYAFYYLTAKFLENTPYKQTLDYCRQEMQKYPVEKVLPEKYASYGKTQLFSKNPFIKFIQLVEREGLRNTLHRLMVKFNKHR